MKVEVVVPGSPSLVGLMVSVDVKHHERRRRRVDRCPDPVLGASAWSVRPHVWTEQRDVPCFAVSGSLVLLLLQQKRTEHVSRVL